ncbi:hypothetical protein L1987_15448 [Smallanthus sonchifolius]|uniref:Uncharacterized protein n=1 Tax=Smallanthus sonchifolius TaxID=185202 RepID=A0ACB9J5Y5_9ASTR|nr:hypothetical protein L1987_15448 [Smallanthus sonchifolius]
MLPCVGVVESTEIDLTEFLEENLEDSDIGENGEAPPSGTDADTTSEYPDEYFQRVTQALVMHLRLYEGTGMQEGIVAVYNVALSPAILSRFDLVHEAASPTFKAAQMRRYIAVAKSKKLKSCISHDS